MAPCLPFSSTYTHPLTGHHSTSPPERPTSTLQLFQRHQTLPQSHSTSHSTTSHITSRTTNSLQPNHYHQHHYSVPTSTSYSRCATNRAAGGHAPTNHPADCAPSRSCSRGRAQLTPQQLIVSPRTFHTACDDQKRTPPAFGLSLSTCSTLSTQFSCPFYLD